MKQQANAIVGIRLAQLRKTSYEKAMQTMKAMQIINELENYRGVQKCRRHC